MEPHAMADCPSRATQLADPVESTSDPDVDEGQLAIQARTERAAFAPLYRKYVRPVYRYFFQQVGHLADAEDLTGTTFSKALASIERFDARGSFAAWLFAIARHTLYDFQRRRRPQTDVSAVAALLVDPAVQPEVQVLQIERAKRLHQLVSQLPSDQRDALLLRFFGELSTKEVAEVLNRSEAAVKMLVHRAITTLRTHYAEEAYL